MIYAKFAKAGLDGKIRNIMGMPILGASPVFLIQPLELLSHQNNG